MTIKEQSGHISILFKETVSVNENLPIQTFKNELTSQRAGGAESIQSGFISFFQIQTTTKHDTRMTHPS